MFLNSSSFENKANLEKKNLFLYIFRTFEISENDKELLLFYGYWNKNFRELRSAIVRT